MTKKWLTSVLLNEMPISPSSPRSICKLSPLSSFGWDGTKSDEIFAFQSGAENSISPVVERLMSRLFSEDKLWRGGWVTGTTRLVRLS